MQPYSIDFRQKIIEVYEQEKISIRKVAKRFLVAKSFVQKLLKQSQQTGDIKPKRQGGNSPPKVQGADLVTLTEIIENNNDATLEELCEFLEEQTGIEVSRATMGRISQNLDYTFQKKLSMPLRKKMKKSSKKELSFGQRFEKSKWRI
jgi:transposase